MGREQTNDTIRVAKGESARRARSNEKQDDDIATRFWRKFSGTCESARSYSKGACVTQRQQAATLAQRSALHRLPLVGRFPIPEYGSRSQKSEKLSLRICE